MKRFYNVEVLIKYKHNWKVHTNATEVCGTDYSSNDLDLRFHALNYNYQPSIKSAPSFTYLHAFARLPRMTSRSHA